MALLAIFFSTIPARQILMPAINAATDDGEWKKFKLLHALSVVITLVHIVIGTDFVFLNLGRILTAIELNEYFVDPDEKVNRRLIA